MLDNIYFKNMIKDKIVLTFDTQEFHDEFMTLTKDAFLSEETDDTKVILTRIKNYSHFHFIKKDK